MTDETNEIFEMASGDISVWVDNGQVICMKSNNKWNDPTELSEKEAQELGELLIRLAENLRN